VINIEASISQGEPLDKLRAGHDLGFTTTYVFARNPEPLAAIELLAWVGRGSASLTRRSPGVGNARSRQCSLGVGT
jgi:hypothetical protein